MVKENKQEKYQRLRRATVLSGICAVCFFIIDSFMFGAPLLSMFALIYVVIILTPLTLISIMNRPRLKYFGYKILIYAVLVVSSFGFHTFDLSIASSRAEVVIAAVDQYQKDKGEYPLELKQLLPDYLEEIPKPRIAPGSFYYFGAPDSPRLMYVEFPPFGRMSWNFITREWIKID